MGGSVLQKKVHCVFCSLVRAWANKAGASSKEADLLELQRGLGLRRCLPTTQGNVSAALCFP